jgi:retron-type reverse transcriptase
LDVDIKGFFDTIDHEMLMKAVRKHSECKWVILYIERWLKAPVKREDGQLENRDKGTPQGGLCKALHNPPYAKKDIMQSKSPQAA